MRQISKYLLKRFIAKRNAKFLSSYASYDDIIIKSPAPYLEFPKGNFTEFILQNSYKWQDLTALECSTTGYKITYSQLVDQSRRWSGFLKRLGIGQGDVVALIAPNNPHFGPLFLGTAAIGAVLSPLNSHFTSGEISKLLGSTKAKILLTMSDVERTVEDALKDVPQLIKQFSIGNSYKGLPNVVDVLNERTIPFADPVELTGEEPLFLPFSSGTTGFPKAVALSHNAFISNTQQYLNPYHDLVPRDSYDGPQETYLAMLPFFHVYGSFVIFTIAMVNGFRVVTLPQFDPNTFVSAIINQKISYLHTVPTLLHFLLSRKECNAKEMSHVHTLMCGAAPVLPSATDAFREKIGKEVAVFEGYGMTEVLITHHCSRNKTHTGSALQLLSNVEAKLVDPKTGKVLPVNEPGEIWMRTPSKMLYYLNNPQATSEIMTDDGWVRSGDIGVVDEKGIFAIVDRMKDLIKVKGLQVSPSEVEEVLKSHPAVMDSSVIGVLDDRLGEAPKAFVVRQSKVSEKELQNFVASKLAKHKHLVGGVTFVESLPKSATGKVLKRELRGMLFIQTAFEHFYISSGSLFQSSITRHAKKCLPTLV